MKKSMLRRKTPRIAVVARKKRIKVLSISDLKKQLDSKFSVWVRKRDSDRDGYITCYTCYRKIPWRDSQNCHYIPRQHNATRYSEINCHAGCVSCNIFKNGNLTEYAVHLMHDYGPEILKNLVAQKNSIKQWNKPELEELIQKYDILV